MDIVGKKGYSADVGMKRIINDGLNNYSRSVSRMMMDEADKDEKYIYIGPADDKTRDLCLRAIRYGGSEGRTLPEIEGSKDFAGSLIDGGGINCRHGWEPVSRDVRSQFYRKEEAEELLSD